MTSMKMSLDKERDDKNVNEVLLHIFLNLKTSYRISAWCKMRCWIPSGGGGPLQYLLPGCMVTGFINLHILVLALILREN